MLAQEKLVETLKPKESTDKIPKVKPDRETRTKNPNHSPPTQIHVTMSPLNLSAEHKISSTSTTASYSCWLLMRNFLHFNAVILLDWTMSN